MRGCACVVQLRGDCAGASRSGDLQAPWSAPHSHPPSHVACCFAALRRPSPSRRRCVAAQREGCPAPHPMHWSPSHPSCYPSHLNPISLHSLELGTAGCSGRRSPSSTLSQLSSHWSQLTAVSKGIVHGAPFHVHVCRNLVLTKAFESSQAVWK